MEREDSRRKPLTIDNGKAGKAVWYAGDWTGPRVLQPEKRLSGDSSSSATHDIVAMSEDGVKVSFFEETLKKDFAFVIIFNNFFPLSFLNFFHR